MNSLKILFLVGTALSTPAGAAWAQTAPAPTPAPAQPPRTQTPPAQTPPAQTPPGQTPPAQTPPAEGEPASVGDVVVSGRTSDVRSSIDSTSYSLANDLQATTGSLADALRNVPSVDVDPQGNVSLRGDANVTILVDGRPSGVLSGEGRAQALLQLPADQYARIEVMTNPSAAYSPEGTGGVINLITKPSAVRAGATTTGSVRANVGDNGRWNAGVNGSWARDRVTLSGDVGSRHDINLQDLQRERDQLNPVTGDVLRTTRQTQSNEGEVDVQFARMTAEYKLTDRIQLTGELRGNLIDVGNASLEAYDTVTGSGAPISLSTRSSAGGFEGNNVGTTARILQRFDDQGHDWTTELRLDRNRGEFSANSQLAFLQPAAPSVFEAQNNRNAMNMLGFTSAYVRPLSNEGRLRAGYELQVQDMAFDNGTSRGASPATLVPDPFVTNRFEAEQAVHALYATWERPWGKISAQFGLRLEYADLELNQITTGITRTQDYFRAYPTMHAIYQLSDTQQVRGSYSRRIQRPPPFLLNPFTSYQDPLSLRSGNPDLEPQETDSFEVMWQLRAGQTFYQATAYYRDTQKAFTDVATDIGNGVLLTRPENLGARRDIGLEVVANGRLHSTLRYNASANVFRQEIDAAGLPGSQNREGTVVSGRVNLNWQPTADDFLQISGLWNGEQLLAQGVREAGGLINLGYRRKMSEKLALVVTVRDLLGDFGDVTTFDTPTFRDRSERSFGGRAGYIGLTYSFGGPSRQQDPQFDFSAAPTGG